MSGICFFDSERKRIDPGLLSDLNMNAIFGDGVCDVLSDACTVEQAEKRQEIFTQLIQGKLGFTFSLLYKTIRNLRHKLRYYNESHSRLEKAVTSYYICELYVDIYDTVVSCETESTLFLELIENQKKQKELIEKIRIELDGIDIENFLSNYAYVQGNSVALTEEDGIPLCEKIALLGRNIGIHIKTKTNDIHYHIAFEAADGILRLHKEETDRLLKLEKYIEMMDLSVMALEDELDFYLKVYSVAEEAHRLGIQTCLPRFTAERGFKAIDAYDITLLRSAAIVPNDIDFGGDKGQVFIVGVNGGGKTTYLRAAAVNLVLALSGCPVFCRNMEVFPFDRIFIHFPKSAEECTDCGNYYEELQRLNAIVDGADSSSFCFLNETFSATDDVRGTRMAIDTARRLREKSAFMLYVTHFVNVIDSEFPTLVAGANSKTEGKYKISADVAKGISFTNDILERYGLSKSQLGERFGVTWK